MHIDIFRRLGDAVRKKFSQKFRTNCWFLLHDRVLGHRSVFVKDFLENQQCDNTGASPILSNSSGSC
jgi:hypothetical protein